MKRFDFKNPHTQRWFLVSGLLVALGFNLSWNPENTHIARYEYAPNATELASTSGTPDKFNLQDINSSFCNATVSYTLDSGSTDPQQTVWFTVKGETEGAVCETCNKVASATVDNKLIKNTEAVKLAISAEASKICAKPDAPPAGGSDKPDPDKVTTACKGKLDDGLVSCQADELTALTDKCEDMDDDSAQRACYRRAQKYFDTYLSKNMARALKQSPDTDAFQDATDARDMLLADLPSHYDNTIRKSLVAMTANALYSQAAQAYNDCLASTSCANGNKGFAATYAKAVISNNLVGYGAPMASALRLYGIDNGSLPAMTNLFNSNYQNPLLQFWMSNSQNGLQFNTDGNLVGTNGSVFKVGSIDQAPFVGLQPVGTLPANITGSLRTGGDAQLTPFTQNVLGTPAAAGAAPRLILNGNQITNTGTPAPPSNLRGM